MAYEVIKKRGKRAYRYRVEYLRNEQGKGQTRWHYLGPVEAGATSPVVAAAPGRVNTAIRLLDALERLLTREEYADVTASAVAKEADVAHGTFYRYFKDKRDALRAAMQRLSERAEHLTMLDAPTESRDGERRRVRTWVREKLMSVSEYPGVWRAWSALSQSDPEVANVRRKLRANYREMFEIYLDRLRALGLTRIEDSQSASRTIFALLYGILHDQFAQSAGLPPKEIIDQACIMVDRLIFAGDIDALS